MADSAFCLELLAAAAESRAVAEGWASGRQSYEDEEQSNRATTPAVDGLDSNRGSLVEEEMEEAELELLPAGHFHPIGCPAPAPRASTPLFRPAAAHGGMPVAMARPAPDFSFFAPPPVPIVMAGHRSVDSQPPHHPQPPQPSQPLQTQQVLKPQTPQPSQPPQAPQMAHNAYVPFQSMNLAVAVGAAQPPFHTALGYAPSFAVPRPLLAPAAPAPAPSPLAQAGAGAASTGAMCCLGQMLTADASHCDPHFVAVRIGNSSRFEHKFCHNCRANGIPVDPSRVWLLNPAYEAAVCTSVGSPGNQHKRFWCHSPAVVPKRFHLFNDKARCTGPKLVVLETALEAPAEALLPVAAPAPSGGGDMDVDEFVRLWISYGTLTLQKSRKAFRPEEHRPAHLVAAAW